MTIEDAELLRRYADKRSEEAFAELVRRHLDFVYGVALRQVGGDTHLAEEVVQVVFSALARKAGSLAQRPVLGGWLCRTTQFAAIDAVRSEDRRRRREHAAHTMHDCTMETGTHPDWEKLGPVLDRTMNELEDEDRDAVWLRFYGGRSFAEIGGKLRLSENAARMRVERALDKLHALLARRGVTSTTAALAVALGNQATLAAPPGLAALVSSAAGTGAAVWGGLLSFMSTTKTMALGAGLVALIAVGTALYQGQAAGQFAMELAALGQERDALRARLTALEKTAPARSVAAGATVPKPAATGGENAVEATDVRARRSRAWQPASPLNFALEHPEARAAFVEQEVLRAKARFDRFFESAGVSAEQQTEVMNQLKTLAEGMLDYYQAVRAQGFGPMNPPQDPQVLLELLRMENQVQEGPMKAIRATLGDELDRQFSAFRKSIPEQNVADQLAGRLYDTGTPLTAQQATQLVQILKENRCRDEATPSAGDTLNGVFVSPRNALTLSNLVHGDVMMPALSWPAPVSDAAMARAQAVLAPAQLAALRQIQAQQAAQYQLAPPAPAGATPEQALALHRKSIGGK